MKRVKDVLSRLRAALTPQAMLMLLLALLLLGLAAGGHTGETALEARTARTLSGVAGAGKVEVTIRTREVAVSSGALGSAQTQQVPCGAVAVAQGADDPQVAMALREALCALLGLPAASVSIVTGGG